MAERISQHAKVQELVAPGQGISIVPAMARRLDADGWRDYRSFSGETPRRTLAVAWNPYRYQSKWVTLLREHVREADPSGSAER